MDTILLQHTSRPIPVWQRAIKATLSLERTFEAVNIPTVPRQEQSGSVDLYDCVIDDGFYANSTFLVAQIHM